MSLDDRYNQPSVRPPVAFNGTHKFEGVSLDPDGSRNQYYDYTFASTNGAPPDPDKDGDGIPDSVDQCDNMAEDFDGYEDWDGCPEPGPFGEPYVCDGVTSGAYLYTIENYGGDCLRVDHDVSDLNQTLNGQNFNDRTKAIEFVGIQYVRVCRDANDGNCVQLDASVPDLAPISMESAISSVYLSSPDEPPQPQDDWGSCDGTNGAYFYKLEDYNGDCLRVSGGLHDFGSKSGDHNDKAKSIKLVGINYIRACRDANAGNCREFTESVPNLAPESMESAISSAYVWADRWGSCDGRPGAELHWIENYQGNCVRVFKDVSNLADFTWNGKSHNDKAKSIRFVGIDYLRVCLDADAGNCRLFFDSVPNLAPHSYESSISSVYFSEPPPDPPGPTPTPFPADTPPPAHTPTATPTPTPTDTPSPQGDVSCDGAVDVVDALFILQYEVGLTVDSGGCPLPPNTLDLAAGDVNKDGTTNVVDGLFILQCEVGQKPGANMGFCKA